MDKTQSNQSSPNAEVEEFLTVDQAIDQVLSLGEVLEPELVPFTEAYGRILSKDLVSDINVSPFDNSAMDGFAVRAQDVVGASEESPVTLDVIEVISAGSVAQHTVGPGQCARIMTGAALPKGADAVVMIERTSAFDPEFNPAKDTDDKTGIVQIYDAVEQWKNVRRAGEEVKAGEVVIHKGDRVNAATIGLMAATGNANVEVYRTPVVGVISTGNELVDVTDIPGPGQIRNSNSYALAAQVYAAGGKPKLYPVVEDTYEATYEAFKKAAQECDLIITSGGVSEGDFDFVRPAIEAQGNLLFCKVKIRPGEPQTMGKIGKTVFFGLPGNPSACYVGFEVFLRPLIKKMQGHTHLRRPVIKARLLQDQYKRVDSLYFYRGNAYRDKEGTWVADVQHSQSSALLTAAHEGNAFVVLPPVVGEVKAGTEVDCWLLDVEENAQV